MIAPRWRKALADVTTRPGRSILAVLAMVVGVASIGMLAFEKALLKPVLADIMDGTEPSSFIVYLDEVDDELVSAINEMSNVGAAEARATIMARFSPVDGPKDVWVPAILYAIRDFDKLQVDLFLREQGAWPPGKDDILVERTAVRVANASIGDQLRLQMPGTGEKRVRFTGTTYAAGLAPAWMEHVIYGFIPWDSSLREGDVRESLQILVRVADNADETGHVNEVAGLVEDKILALGYTVRRVAISSLGHPHAGQMNAFMYLIGSFGLLAFLLSAVLVASMIHTLQSEQIKQVGIMKAIGATSAQITSVYLAQVGMLASIALTIGLPIGWFAGRAYAEFASGILNADVSRVPFPLATMFMTIGVGVAVPLLAALVPVMRASRVTVREALSHDAGARPFGFSAFVRRLTTFNWLSRPLALTFRTAVQCRGRLALAVGMLAIGGGIFMSSVNVSKGWETGVDDYIERFGVDVVVRFSENQSIATIDSILATLPSVGHHEYWSQWVPYFVDENGVALDRLSLWGVAPNSELFNPDMMTGEWPQDDITPGVIINNAAHTLDPSLRVGDSVTLRFRDETITLPIIGISREMAPIKAMYTSRAVVRQVAKLSEETTRTVHVVGSSASDGNYAALIADIETAMGGAGIEVQRVFSVEDLRGVLLDHLVIIQSILLMAALLVILVAGIGLGSTLTVNVLQRTRKIGIMSAIGATPRKLATYVWLEGMMIVVLSWVAANLVAIPIGKKMGQVTGYMMSTTSVSVLPTWQSAFIWLGIVVILGSIASFYPARKAARLTVREAIAHF